MEQYEVRPSIRRACGALLSDPEIAKAVSFLARDNELRLAEQIAIARIPAPSFHETQRAQDLAGRFRALSLEDVRIDGFGNVTGVRRGIGGGPRIAIDAHTDTVFDIDTPLEPRTEGTRVHMPGINDDASGLAAMLSVIRALDAADIKTAGDLIFCGITAEEVGLKGMADFLGKNTFDACISVDCDGIGYFVYGSMGRQQLEYTFLGQGGHVGRGDVSHAAYAAARAAVNISKIPLRDGTTLTVSGIKTEAGSKPGQVCRTASVQAELQALSQADLDALRHAIEQAVSGACSEENERQFLRPVLPPPPIMAPKRQSANSALAADPRVTCQINVLSSIPPAQQDPHSPLLEGLYAIYQSMGIEEPLRIASANSNAAEAIRKGIPGLTMGCGGSGGGVHTLDEYFDAADMDKGASAVMLLALLMAGVPGTVAPQIETIGKA
ncbi:MAG TPA: M20/M25/M40 family metallo-hydrolase [Clostridia bacterium]|nr:M20/M25/M40 family metallo-hydrolase [Clostridia bacterium]